MKYKISVSEDGKYVRIRVLETITDDMGRELAAKAIHEANQSQINKYLVDVRQVANIFDILEQYLFADKDMYGRTLDIFSRIAVLLKAEDNTHAFMESVFLNAGYCCRLFVDEGAALRWLKEDVSGKNHTLRHSGKGLNRAISAGSGTR